MGEQVVAQKAQLSWLSFQPGQRLVVVSYSHVGLHQVLGIYLALATLNRVVSPCSKLAFADWWAGTAADRWVKVPAAALDQSEP